MSMQACAGSRIYSLRYPAHGVIIMGKGGDGCMWVQIQTLAKQVLSGCEQKGTDKLQLDYDPRNPFDICSATFTPIYRGNPFAEDPYTKAR